MIVSPLTGVNYNIRPQENHGQGNGESSAGAQQFIHELAASSVLGRFDSDGSGGISREESGLEAAVFDRIDADGDGEHSQEEILNDLLADPKTFHRELAGNILSQRDLDGDGVISLEESGLDAILFGTVDTDGNGMHSLEEMVAYLDAALHERTTDSEAPRAGLPGVSPQQLFARYQNMQNLF